MSDRAARVLGPGEARPAGFDNIPGYGLLKEGQCRTAGCLEHRHHMGKATGYCKKCKIERGLLKPQKLETFRRAVEVPVPNRPEPEAEKPPTVPIEFVDEAFAMVRTARPFRLLRALIDTWAELPIGIRVQLMRATMRVPLAQAKEE